MYMTLFILIKHSLVMKERRGFPSPRKTIRSKSKSNKVAKSRKVTPDCVGNNFYIYLLANNNILCKTQHKNMNLNEVCAYEIGIKM